MSCNQEFDNCSFCTHLLDTVTHTLGVLGAPNVDTACVDSRNPALVSGCESGYFPVDNTYKRCIPCF